LVLVAETVDRDGVATVGVGRFAATSDAVVEVAFAVVDSWHRQGVGRRLLSALRFRAMDLGYRVVVADVMAENRAAAGLLFSVFPDATMRRAGTAYQVVATLPEPAGAVALPLAV
jgi:GNAT superfamily N-acetyltransferase